MTNHAVEEIPDQAEDTRWARLGALCTIPDRPGIWSVWSRGSTVDKPKDPPRWFVVPVDATERDRADQAVLVHEKDIKPYVPAVEQDALDTH
jgi:hypothetical protein